MTVSWQYLALAGLSWGIVMVGCSVALVSFRRWSRVATLASATLFQVHAWANHLLFDANSYAVRTWPRDLALSLLFLGFTWTVLCVPNIRQEFK